MRAARRTVGLLLVLPLLAACGSATPGAAPGDEPAPTAATWRVTGPSLTPLQFGLLAQPLGLPEEALRAEGFLHHVDLDRFAQVPTLPPVKIDDQDEEQAPLEAVAFDFDAIAAVSVVSEDAARSLVAGALATADLLEPGKTPYQTAMVTDHSRFRAEDLAGNVVADVAIDTDVAFEFALGAVPVVGPGAKVKFVFAPDGALALAIYALRPVVRADDVPIRDAAEVEADARERFQPLLDQGGTDLELRLRLVYYAPPPELVTVQTIYPHYEVNGSWLPAGATERAHLRTVLLPAAKSPAQPVATLRTSFDGKEVEAEVSIQGGIPPYDIGWTSSQGGAGKGTDGKSVIRYPLGTSPLPGMSEFVGVTVTDGNGITASATGVVAPVPQDVPPPWGDEGVLEHGSEWVGRSQGLPRSGRNATRFVTRLAEVSIPRFNRGDLHTAERRWRDVTLGGADNLEGGVDGVDLAFFSGHAGGVGWNFPTPYDDGLLSYRDARYGDGDLEWLFIAACGPLQLVADDPPRGLARWAPAFQGLHLLCGYANVTVDNLHEGYRLADRLIAGHTVRQAWLATAIDTQGREQIAAVMGVYASDGRVNFEDHLHGRGSVGPDLLDPMGIWHIYMNCR